jgi:hypothetical protein
MKKFLLISVTLCIWSLGVTSQCYFYKTYPYEIGPYVDYAASFVEWKHNFYTTGMADGSTINDLAIYGLGVDACGDTLWKKAYDYTPFGGESGDVILSLGNNGFCTIGSRYDSVQGFGEGLILFTDTLGNATKIKVMDAGYENEIVKDGLVVDNGILALGYFNGFTGNHAFLVKTDFQGNVLWQKRYGFLSTDVCFTKNLTLANDRGYVISGSAINPNTGAGALFLIKTDSIGNKQWAKTYSNTYYQGAALANKEGGYVLAGNEKPAQGLYNGYVGKMDSAGNVIWERRFDKVWDCETFVSVLEMTDGNYLLGGAGIKRPNGSSIPKAVLVKLSKDDGSVIWQRDYTYYGGNSDDYIEKVIQTEEGDITACGWIIPAGASMNRNETFILKTDSCGYLSSTAIDAGFTFAQNGTHGIDFNNQSQSYCTAYWYFGDGSQSNSANPNHTYADTGIYTVTLIVRAGNSTDTIVRQVNVGVPSAVASLSLDGLGVGFYPNPAKSNVTITTHGLVADAYVVCDLTGRAVLNGAIESNNQAVDISGISKGVYLLRVIEGGKVVGNGKVVKE